MAEATHVGRRALLQGALMAPAIAAMGAPALASMETPILRLYREYEDIVAHMNDTATPHAEFDRLYPISVEIEERMEREPVTCLADLAAKVMVLTAVREADSVIYEPSVRAECEAILAGLKGP